MKCFTSAALLCMGVLAFEVPHARAALLIEYSTDNGLTWNQLASSSNDAVPASYSGAAGSNFTLTLSGVSGNAPGTANGAEELSGALTVTNSGLSGTQSIWLGFVAQDFTAPITPPGPPLTFDSHIGGGLTRANAANTLAFTSCVDANNGNVGVTGICPAGSISLTGNPNIGSGMSFDNDQNSTINTLTTTPYALSQILEITLAQSSSFNFTTSTTLTPVPEPFSIVLLGGAILLTGRLMRRKQNLD